MNVTSTTPFYIAIPLVGLFVALRPILKPDAATSIARTLIVMFLYVSAQHLPQLAEFHDWITWAPPMFGKFLSEPKVVRPMVSRPFEPSEHATVEREPDFCRMWYRSWAELA